MNSCMFGALVHFQGWKRNWYVHTLPPMPSGSTFHNINGVLSETGFFPFHDGSQSTMYCVDFDLRTKLCYSWLTLGHDVTILVGAGQIQHETTVVIVGSYDILPILWGKLKILNGVEKVRLITVVWPQC
jgi:hypothetical protein